MQFKSVLFKCELFIEGSRRDKIRKIIQSQMFGPLDVGLRNWSFNPLTVGNPISAHGKDWQESGTLGAHPLRAACEAN